MMATKRTAKTAPEKPKDIHCPIQMSPSAGDKTPAVVDWWFANHPEIAAAKYRGRKTHRDALERERLTKAMASELPAPYNLKTVTKEFKKEGYATEYGIAWLEKENERVQHRPQKLDNAVTGIPSPVFIRCVRISKGAGWKIARLIMVSAPLRRQSEAPITQPAPFVARLIFTKWFKEKHDELEAWIMDACEQNADLAAAWEKYGKGIKTGSPDYHTLHASSLVHLMNSLARAFQSLDRLELKLDYGERTDSKLTSNDGDAFFITAMKAGFEAGRRLHEVRAELANIKLMKMGSNTARGKGVERRTEWLMKELAELEHRLGRKARTMEVIEHIKGKKDPVSGQVIWFGKQEGDDQKTIEWSEHDLMSVKTLADKISHIRKSKK